MRPTNPAVLIQQPASNVSGKIEQNRYLLPFSLPFPLPPAASVGTESAIIVTNCSIAEVGMSVVPKHRVSSLRLQELQA
jgi:hypothetical protein